MIVRMVHPEHGAMHVYDAGELERVRKFGWVPEDEAAQNMAAAQTLPAAVAEPEIVPLPVVDEPPRRKPGRPRKGE